MTGVTFDLVAPRRDAHYRRFVRVRTTIVYDNMEQVGVLSPY